MAALWTDVFKFQMWLMIELAVLKAREVLGQIPAGTYVFVQSKTWMDEQVAEVIDTVQFWAREKLISILHIAKI